MPIYFIFLLIALLIYIYYIISILKKSKELTQSQKNNFNKILKNIQQKKSASEQIIFLDKLYHKILKSFWHTGTFWEILKTKPSQILNLQKIWELHKLRNTLVHEFQDTPEKVLQIKASEYIWEIKRIIQ